MVIHNSKGFTLIEVMIAMAIFAIGILAVTKMQISSVNGNASARESTEATAAAYDQIEKLMSTPFVDISDDNTIIDGYSITQTVTEEDSDGDGTNEMKSIGIVVNDLSDNQSVTLTFKRYSGF